MEKSIIREAGFGWYSTINGLSNNQFVNFLRKESLRCGEFAKAFNPEYSSGYEVVSGQSFHYHPFKNAERLICPVLILKNDARGGIEKGLLIFVDGTIRPDSCHPDDNSDENYSFCYSHESKIQSNSYWREYHIIRTLIQAECLLKIAMSL